MIYIWIADWTSGNGFRWLLGSYWRVGKELYELVVEGFAVGELEKN